MTGIEFGYGGGGTPGALPVEAPEPTDAMREALAKAETSLVGWIDLVCKIHQNDLTEQIADNGMTVLDAVLTETAQRADQSACALAAIRKALGETP